MLGDILRQEREKQNLSVKDVEQETSIRTLYISSIEEGNYAAIPGEVYLKGFIKTYANFLNLDGTEMLKLYYEETNSGKQQEEVAEVPVDKMEDLADKISDRKSIKELRKEKGNNEGNIAKMAVGLAVCLCIGGAAYFMFGGSQTENGKEAKTVVAETPAPKAEPAKEQPKAKPVEPAVNGVDLKTLFTGKCWIQVEADGKVLFEGTPKINETLTWKADKELSLTVGNAGAVEAVLNGKSLGKLGNVGEVVTKKFTKESGTLPKQ